MWWALPLRSLWRSRRRTVLSLAIIAFGTAISVFVLGFVQDSRALIQESTVAEYGNLQIASPTLWDGTNDGYSYLISPDHVAALTAVLKQEAAYRDSTPQLQFPGLLASGAQTRVVRATAVVPGNDVLSFDNLVTKGRGLLPSDTGALLMGRTLADQLGLSVGDAVTLTVTTVDGAYNVSPFRIAGIYEFSNEQVEQQVLFVPLAFGQLLLNTTNVDRLIIALNSLRETRAAADRVQGLLDRQEIPLEVKTWDELSPFYRQLSSYFDALFGFLSLAVFVLVFFIILQVLTLAFLERTREIGTLRAIGTTRGEVFRLFFTESAWLAVFGSGAGVAVGILLGIAFNAVGIEWQPPGTVSPVLLAVQMGWTTVALPLAVSLAATLLSAVFPAVQASRLQVVDALRVE